MDSTFNHDIIVGVVDIILLGIGYLVGRTGISGTITDIKNDIAAIKNWIDPSKTTTVVTTASPVTPTVSATTTTN